MTTTPRRRLRWHDQPDTFTPTNKTGAFSVKPGRAVLPRSDALTARTGAAPDGARPELLDEFPTEGTRYSFSTQTAPGALRVFRIDMRTGEKVMARSHPQDARDYFVTDTTSTAFRVFRTQRAPLDVGRRDYPDAGTPKSNRDGVPSAMGAAGDIPGAGGGVIDETEPDARELHAMRQYSASGFPAARQQSQDAATPILKRMNARNRAYYARGVR